jgi:hypothetical protein
MSRYGIENKTFRCSRTDASYELTLYFSCKKGDDREYFDFNCTNKFNCGVYGNSETAFGEFRWGICPAHKKYKPEN